MNAARRRRIFCLRACHQRTALRPVATCTRTCALGPSFSIALKSSGKCDLVVWNPSKWNTACIQLRMGEREGILAVVSPHNFSAMADEIDALSKEKPNANKSFQRTVKKLRFLPSAEFKR